MKLKKLSLEMFRSHPIWNWYRLDEDELKKSLSEWLTKKSKTEIINGLISVSQTMRRQWEESISIMEEIKILYERKSDSKKLFGQLERLRAELKKIKTT